MPIQFPNFQRLSFEESNPALAGVKTGLQIFGQGQDILSKLLEQQKAQKLLPYVEPLAKEELQKAILYNKFYERDKQSQIGLRGAQAGLAGQEASKIEYELSHPGYLGGEETKTIQALKDMGIPTNNISSAISSNQQPNNNLTTNKANLSSTPFNTGNPLVDSILNRKFAQTAYQQKMTQAFNWVHSPYDTKNYQIAQLAGAGIDPSEAVSLLSSGNTVPEILKNKGFDPDNAPEPDFLPTRGNIEKLVQRRAALAEVQSLGDFIRKGLGPYSETILGFSPTQMSDALSGMNEDKQAEFLAARGLAPELTNVRLMLAQARTGKYAMQSMLGKSLTDINIFRSLVSKKVWDRAQKIMDDKLTDAFEKSEKIYTVGKNKNKSEKNDPLGIR